MVEKTMGLIVVLDLGMSVSLLGLTGGAAGRPLIGLMPGARVMAPLALEAVPDGKNGRIVVLFSGAKTKCVEVETIVDVWVVVWVF
jgi:hypothetical protein